MPLLLGSPVAILASLRLSSNSKGLNFKHFSLVVQWGRLDGCSCPGEIIRDKCLGDNCRGGNYSGVIAWPAKVRGIIVLG